MTGSQSFPFGWIKLSKNGIINNVPILKTFCVIGAVEAHAFNSSTQETDTGGSLWVQDQLGLQSKFHNSQSYTEKLWIEKQNSNQPNKPFMCQGRRLSDKNRWKSWEHYSHQLPHTHSSVLRACMAHWEPPGVHLCSPVRLCSIHSGCLSSSALCTDTRCNWRCRGVRQWVVSRWKSREPIINVPFPFP